MADITLVKISALPAAEQIGAEDLLPVVHEGATKAIAYGVIKDDIAEELAPDATLSEAGKAADAKAVGDALALKADKTELTTDVNRIDAALATKANTNDVNAALALKADTATVNAELATKAGTDTVNAALALKADKTELTAGLAAKQDTLTFDNTPIEGSTNPVTSDGVWEASEAFGIVRNNVYNSTEYSKNLLCIHPEYIGKEYNGITITRKENGAGYIVNGTCTENVNISANGNLAMTADFPAGTYTFKLSNISGFSSTSRFSVRYNYVIGTPMTVIVNQNTTNRQKTITFESPANVAIFFMGGDTYNNASFTLQIESGETATDYELPAGIADYSARNRISTIEGDITTINNDISEAEADISELQGYVISVTDKSSEEISMASYKVVDDRYENIDYCDITGDIESIDPSNSESADFDYGVRFHDMPYSVKITTNAGNYSDCIIRVKTPIAAAGMQEVVTFLYVEDATKATKVRVDLLDVGMNKTTAEGALQNGWNKIRMGTYGAGTINIDGTNTRYRLRVYCSASTRVWIGRVIVVKPDRANIIFIEDHGYKSFYEIAYPAFKNIGVPITWAIDPLSIEDESSHTGTRPTMSLADIEALAVDGISEFSFHNYDGSASANATAVEALYDTVNNIRWLKKKGLAPERMFRGAWQGNTCPNHELADLEVDASASYDGTTGPVVFPFPDRYNIPRLAMQGRTTDLVDTWFNALKTRHYTLLFYTHGISDNSQDTSETMLNYFVSKTLEGIQEGWLNPTTYNRLISHYRRIS